MPNSASLADMVDLALGTPELGCVNYIVLHKLLHAVLHHLHIDNNRAELPDEGEAEFLSFIPKDDQSKLQRFGKRIGTIDSNGTAEGEDKVASEEKDRLGVYPISEADSGVTGTAYGIEPVEGSEFSNQGKDAEELRSVPITRSPYHQLQEKVDRLENLLRDLDSLPSNRELWDRAGGDRIDRMGDQKPRPVAEMWQSLQLSRKVDANTQGVSKLMSLVEDLMLELQSLKQANHDLRAQMERSKQNEENLMQLVSRMEQKVKELDDQMPTDEVLEGFVTWSALEDSLKGLKLAFDETTTTMQQNFQTSISQRDVDLLNDHESTKSADQLVAQVTAMEMEPDIPKDVQSRPMSRRRSRMSTPGPSLQLQDLLEGLGKLNERHEQLETRVDLLEVEVAKKGDLEMLRSLGFSEGLNEQIRKMLEDIDIMKDMRTQDSEYIDQLQKLTNTFQLDLDKLNSSVVGLSEDSLKHDNHFEDLFSACRELEEKKADKEFVQNEVNLKADKEILEGKVNRSQFEMACDEINQMINDILNKLLGSQGEWKTALDQLNNDIDGKLDRLEFAPFRDELEKQLRALAKKIASLQATIGEGGREPDEAAGIRKQLIQRFHCISCDRPLEMMPQKAVPSLPSVPGMPDAKANRPFVIYELDQVRQQKRNFNWSPQYTEVVDLYATSRPCGGSHTMTYPHRRLIRSSNPGPGVFADDSPPHHPPPPYRNETEVGNFSRVRTTSAAPGGTSASTSRLPNVHPLTNRTSSKSVHAYMDPVRPQSPQPIRPTSAQLLLRPLSSRNDGLSRSKTMMPASDEPKSQRATSVSPMALSEQVPEVRVPVSQIMPEDRALHGSSVSAFQELVQESSALVDETEN